VGVSGPVKRVLKGLAGAIYGIPGAASAIPERWWAKAGVIDPFVLKARDLKLSLVTPGGDGPRVLFLRMRFVPRLSATELVLAKRLAEDGARPEFAYCSPVLRCCNGWDVRSDDPRAECLKCHRGNRRLAEMLPWPSTFLEEYLNEDDFRDARGFARVLGIEDLKSLTVEGHDLGNEMYRSLAKYLFIGTIPETPENLELARGFGEAAFLLVRGLSRLFDCSQPEVVVMNCGHVMWYGIANALLHERGTRVVTFDETNIAVTHLSWNFDDGHPCVDYVWDEQWARVADVPLTDAQDGAIRALLDERTRLFLYEPASTYESAPELEGLEQFSAVYALFTNVPWDATIVGKDIVFPSMQDWVESAVRIAEAHRDVALIIRVHPAEAGVYGMISRERVAARLAEKYPQLPDNVFLIDAERKVNSYALIERCDGVLAYCSNVGLEALLMGKATIVSGAAHYRDKGLSRDIRTTEEFASEFGAWCNSKPAAPDSERARRYAYLAFIENQLDVHLFVDAHPHQAMNLAVADLSAKLPPEADEVFGALSAWIRAEDVEPGAFTNTMIRGERP
jgi:hypothetical protein